MEQPLLSDVVMPRKTKGLFMQTRLSPRSWSIALACSFAMSSLLHSRVRADDPQTLADCEGEYAQCFERAGFFGYFFCPQRYDWCVAQVRGRLPSELTQALDQLDNCERLNALCRTASEGDPQELSYCSREQNVCIMNAFGIEPSPERPKDALCIQDAMRCARASQTSDGLEQCAQSLQRCLATPTPPL